LKEKTMKSLYLAAALGSAIALAACSGPDSGEPPAANTNTASETMSGGANMSGDMGNMAMPAATSARGTGTVKAIDKATGTVTLDHGPIPEANWPAMSMAFKAAPGLLESVHVGDKVAFELALKDGAGQVTAISKQ
jgi:Cu(I)/Ag(I) efflux system protein CusF